MHEMTLCRHIMAIIQQQINDLSTLHQVTLKVGTLAAVDNEALTFWFPVIAAEYGAKSTIKLIIDTISASGRCQQCQQQFPLRQRLTACPNCHSYHYQLITGDELTIKSVEVN